MNRNIPHLIPYQGSKRKLAERILDEVRFPVHTLFEPFAGSAAITLAAVHERIGKHYIISDKLKPLAEIWQMVLEDPNRLADKYDEFWNAQHGQEKEFFNSIRKKFNENKGPAELLFLIARCVKNSIRFNSNGDFNQGPDNRRLGMNPNKVRREILRIHNILRGKATVLSADYRTVLQRATSDDLVYMDPPWQGTSGNRDPRYAFTLNLEELIEEMERLNDSGVPFLLSFDGECGNRTYGKDLPPSLALQRVPLDAGRSSQATLLGRTEVTIESLYLSPALVAKNKEKKRKEKTIQAELLFT